MAAGKEDPKPRASKVSRGQTPSLREPREAAAIWKATTRTIPGPHPGCRTASRIFREFGRCWAETLDRIRYLRLRPVGPHSTTFPWIQIGTTRLASFAY